jgi:crossover junction endodeoxyribonuclease RuvC
MLIIGIDPGLAKTGWGVIRKDGNKLSYIASGVIETKADLPIQERLLIIYKSLIDAMNLWKPECAAMEETFVNMNSKSSLKLAHARGASMVAVASYGISLEEYAPNLVKKTVVGVGRAEKDQVSRMVKVILPTSNINLSDESDAIAVAICHSSFFRKIN